MKFDSLSIFLLFLSFSIFAEYDNLEIIISPNDTLFDSIHHKVNVDHINYRPDRERSPGTLCHYEWPGLEELSFEPVADGLRKSSSATPAMVNNSTLPQFRPVFIQKGNSCLHASAVGYIYTYEINSVRNLPSNTDDNLYPYDFTYNFLNRGSGGNGTDGNGWDIIRFLGIPNVTTYGGFGLDQHNRWVSGYEVYESAMTNRLESEFGIAMNTKENLEQMKRWLFDRGNNSKEGGLLQFVATTDMNIVTLTSDTLYNGKHAITSFGNGGGAHAMTIVGYDDDVCYDYDGDGFCNNPTDDVRTWEKGAVIFANSMGDRWLDSGFAYLMYRTLFLTNSNGGISANFITGIRVNSSQPYNRQKLAYKIRISHPNRDKLKVEVGFSNNSNAVSADLNSLRTFRYIMTYTGGKFPVQGISEEPLEIGLDVSDFHEKLSDSAAAAFFLYITSDSGNGILHDFSLVDYTGVEPVEFQCVQKDALFSSGTTIFKIERPVNNLTLLTPNGGELWEHKKVVPVTWTPTGNHSMKIVLLKSDSVVVTIAESIPDNGNFSWYISEEIGMGSDYKIRISCTTNYSFWDESDSVFSIKSTDVNAVLPNQAKAFFSQIKCNSRSVEISNYYGTVQIFSINGSLLLKKHVNRNAYFDVTNLPKGVFLIKLKEKTVRYTNLHSEQLERELQRQ